MADQPEYRKLVTIIRPHRTGGMDERTILVRCMEHDPNPVVGKKWRFGSGRMFTVTAVRPFDPAAQ